MDTNPEHRHVLAFAVAEKVHSVCLIGCHITKPRAVVSKHTAMLDHFLKASQTTLLPLALFLELSKPVFSIINHCIINDLMLLLKPFQ